MTAQFDETDASRLRVALGRIARQLDRRVTDDGMTRTQLTVLGTIAKRTQLGMSELAEIEGINPTMLSRIVGKLEDSGFVTRTPDADDRRVIRVEITATGAKAHARTRKIRTQLLAEQLHGLPDEQVTALLDALPALEALAAAGSAR